MSSDAGQSAEIDALAWVLSCVLARYCYGDAEWSGLDPEERNAIAEPYLPRARQMVPMVVGALPEPDNHHNASLCPYCKPEQPRVVSTLPKPVDGATDLCSAPGYGHTWRAVGPNAAELWTQCAKCRADEGSVKGRLPCPYSSGQRADS